MGNARDPEVWHNGKVLRNIFQPDNIRYWTMELHALEGKEVQCLIREQEPEKSLNQLAFYFGVIIKRYCMSSNAFAGNNESEIDQYFRQELRSYTATINSKPQKMTDEVGKYTREQMRLFLDEVVALLAREFDIHIDDTVMFKWNKYAK